MAFSSTLRIPVLQAYNQKIINELARLRISEGSDTFQGLGFYQVAGQIVDPTEVSPREFSAGLWSRLLNGDDVDLEEFRKFVRESKHKDLLFIHMLRYLVLALDVPFETV